MFVNARLFLDKLDAPNGEPQLEIPPQFRYSSELTVFSCNRE